jgi:hypothetical protein
MIYDVYVYYTVGELVYNLSLKETVFLDFDVLVYWCIHIFMCICIDTFFSY